MNNAVMVSSKSAEWETPQELFDKLNGEFHFTLDVCATPENAKCENYYTEEQDGLSQPWKGTVWCNPPYGRNIGSWVRRGLFASAAGHTVVMLLPARTDTRWFHEYVYHKAEIRYIKGRLKFGGSINSAPFPSMIVVFRPKLEQAKELNKAAYINSGTYNRAYEIRAEQIDALERMVEIRG